MRTPEQIFEQAYSDFSDAIFRHCAFRLRNRERGVELMQESFLRLWNVVTAGTEVENMRAFLYRIANNLIVDDVRKKKEVSLDEMIESGWDFGDQRLAEIQDQVQLQEILDVLGTMDQSSRQVLVMRYVDGLTPAGIADILEETPNTVSVRLHRAVKELRNQMDKPHASRQLSEQQEPLPGPNSQHFSPEQADIL